jgi:hypothetical protein
MAAEGLDGEIEDLVCQLERHAGCRVPDGYNSELRFMCHLWDPLRHVYRYVQYAATQHELVGLVPMQL